MKPERPFPFRWVGAGLLVALVLLMVAWQRMAASSVPLNLDLSTTRMSAQGFFRVQYVSELQPLPVGKLHSWTVRVETPTGEPVTGAILRLDGDMPQHGHGLPTRPQMGADLGNGTYRMEGIRFQMPGWWVMDLEVQGQGHTDQVQFNLLLEAR